MDLCFKLCVYLFSCWLLVLVQGDSSNDLIKCENESGSCEQFSFGRVQQNVSNVSNNNLSHAKLYKAHDLNDFDVVENQMAYEQAHTQENGNLDMIVSSRSKICFARDHHLMKQMAPITVTDRILF